jgi:hypothetical protein
MNPVCAPNEAAPLLHPSAESQLTPPPGISPQNGKLRIHCAQKTLLRLSRVKLEVSRQVFAVEFVNGGHVQHGEHFI